MSYAFDGGKDLLIRAFSLELASGDSVVLRGKSGSGKTTLIRMAVGLYNPTSGAIFVNGAPVSRYGLARFRSQCGVVLQDDDVLPGTIAENVSFFRAGADRERIIRCLQDAQIWSEVMRLPLGLETFLGESGFALSAGQKQRILIARALYNNPSTVILDEATANVDEACEARILDALKKRGGILIFVSHRSSVADAATRVIEVEEGTIRESSLTVCGTAGTKSVRFAQVDG